MYFYMQKIVILICELFNFLNFWGVQLDYRTDIKIFNALKVMMDWE